DQMAVRVVVALDLHGGAAWSQSANDLLTPKPNLSKRKLRLPGCDWDCAPPANSGTIWVCVLKLADPTKNPVKRKPPISGLGSPIVCRMLSRSSISFSAGAVTCALIELAGAVGGAATAGVTTAGGTTAAGDTRGCPACSSRFSRSLRRRISSLSACASSAL